MMSGRLIPVPLITRLIGVREHVVSIAAVQVFPFVNFVEEIVAVVAAYGVSGHVIRGDIVVRR